MEIPAEKSANATEVDATEIGKRGRRVVRRQPVVHSTLLPHKPREQDENGGNQVKQNNGGDEEELCGSQGKKKRKSAAKSTPQSRSSKKQTTGKRVLNLTPKKILHAEEATPSSSPTIPNLRLEEKMTREEHSRMFAGRKIHPFFSSMKAGKNCQEATQSAESGCVERKKSGTGCNTIHVYERTGDDDEPSPNWQNWTFLDKNIVHIGHTLQNTCSSAFEGCIKSLSFDDLPIVLPASDAIEEPMDNCFVKKEYIKESSTVCNVDAGKEMMRCHLLCSAEVDGNVNKTSGLNGTEARPIPEHQSRFLQDRMQSYYLRCQSLPENCLWTYKYQPKMAMEVCGNFESVKLLSEWLHLWHERKNNKGFAGGKTFLNQDDNDNSSQSDSDYESPDGEDSLKKVLLVTGSYGSGKSAAIYACAKEHGFKVFELSSSNVRSGAVLKQMYGGASDTHQLNWSGKNSQGPRNNFIEKDGEELECVSSDDVEIEVIPLSDDDSKDYIKGGRQFECITSESTSSQGEAKALILIEDVDIIFPMDRGLISAIQEIADNGKRPIILTSNNRDPVLPDNLVGLQVSFIRPSSTELLSHLYMICASEGVNIRPCLLECIIHCYRNDIRKAIMHLQFLCQGKGFRDKIQKKYGPLLFDRDAGHQILPSLIPWSFPSHLSELVDKEITKLLLRTETTSCSSEASKGELYEWKMQNGQQYQNFEGRFLLEAKRAAMLSRNGSIQGHSELALECDAAHECSDISGTPIPSSWQKRRRRLDMVVSSDSGDEPINKECFLVPNKDGSILSSHHPRPPNYLSSLNGLLYQMSANTVEDHNPCSVTVCGIDLNEASMPITTSYVPESIFVPETEIHDMELFPKIASRGDAGASAEVSTNGPFQNVLLVEANSFYSHTCHPIQETTAVLENSCNAFNSSHREGERFSCNGHMEVIGTHNLMDECSHVDFNKSKFIDKPELNVCGIDLNEASIPITNSYVPESIFVPETEIHDMELFPKIASRGDAGASPEVSTNGPFQNVLLVEANSFNSHTCRPVQETTAVLENSCNAFNSSHREGERFSCNGHMEDVIGTHNLMDECSHVDFNKSKFIDKPELNVCGIDLNEASMPITTSYVPESIFVPETEIHDMELFPKIASRGDAGVSSEVSTNGPFQNVLLVEANSFDSHTCRPVQETTAVLENSCNAFNSSHREGERFSCNGHMEDVIGTHNLMDECSHVDFNKSKFIEKPELNVSDGSVNELWIQIRLHHLDLLGHHAMPEKQETVQIVELVHKMIHLISDSDLLLSSYQPQMPTFVSEEPDSFFWGCQQLEMSSTIGQHGFCSIASDIATAASRVGLSSKMDIVPEMLASMAYTNTAALGKLTRYNMMDISSSTTNDLEPSLSGHSHNMQESNMKSRLFDVIQHVAPKRSHVALKGVQFFEYLSTLRCISRLETSRISKGPDKTKRRRGRVAQHYLSTGSNLFSPGDITLLEQSNLPSKDIQRS